MIGTGAALVGGSKLIQPAQAQSGYEDLVLNQAANFLQYFADNFNFSDISANYWRTFADATLATFSVMREWGLDQQLNDLYGIDEFATGCVGQAFDEGGWDQFWALQLLPVTGFQAEFGANYFENIRTHEASNVWINGTGPLSAGFVDAGYAEFAPWPSNFNPDSGAPLSPETLERLGTDDATIATVGGVPWYSPYNPYMPTVPLNSTAIWIFIPIEDRCKALNRLFLLSKGLGLVAGLAGGIPAKIVAGVLVYAINIMTDYTCGKI